MVTKKKKRHTLKWFKCWVLSCLDAILLIVYTFYYVNKLTKVNSFKQVMNHVSEVKINHRRLDRPI